MATKQEFLDSIKRLEASVASRQASSAAAQAKITELISEGKNREAYRVFEELPIMDQIALSVTPGFGDALAAFEVGEFKTRAGERFEQDDTLGGLGNLALSGLAGASLLPIIGPVAGAAGKVGKSLGRVAKTDLDMPAGGGSSSSDIPNEYVGTRPSDLGDGFGNAPGTGLISPNRLALEKMATKPLKLDTLVAQLRKAAPNKEGELRMLGLLDEKNQVTPLARQYFTGQPKVTPKALDQFLSQKQRTALNIVRPKKSNYESPGYGDINADTEVQRVYQVEGVKNALARGKHYGGLGFTDDIAFDSTDFVDGDGVLRVGRIQSDYDKMLKIEGEKGKSNALFDETDAAKKRKISEEGISPFELPDRLTEFPKFSSDAAGADKLRDLMKKFNENVQLKNKIMNERLAPIYEAGIRPTTDFIKLPNIRPKEIKQQAKRLDKQNLLIRKEIGDTIEEIENKLFKVSDFIGHDFKMGDYDLVRKFDIDKLPRAARLIAERELNYENLPIPSAGFEKVTLDPQYYRFTNSEVSLDLSPSFDIEKSIEYLDTTKANASGVDLDANLNFNINKPKLDPYATAGAKKTKSYVLPVRNLMNESLQNPNISTLKIQGLEPLQREGGVSAGVPSKILQKYYKNAQKEAIKVVNEIADGSDLFVVNKFGDDIEIDLDQIRDYLKDTGKEAKISAFKTGGAVKIQSLLDNL
ncbi:hypothetical protein OA493_01995 [Gammaproteobacteria bacterium]|nr:hypothetical protein [Gammaproteobacteria bacterium]